MKQKKTQNLIVEICVKDQTFIAYMKYIRKHSNTVGFQKQSSFTTPRRKMIKKKRQTQTEIKMQKMIKTKEARWYLERIRYWENTKSKRLFLFFFSSFQLVAKKCKLRESDSGSRNYGDAFSFIFFSPIISFWFGFRQRSEV